MSCLNAFAGESGSASSLLNSCNPTSSTGSSDNNSCGTLNSGQWRTGREWIQPDSLADSSAPQSLPRDPPSCRAWKRLQSEGSLLALRVSRAYHSAMVRQHRRLPAECQRTLLIGQNLHETLGRRQWSWRLVCQNIAATTTERRGRVSVVRCTDVHVCFLYFTRHRFSGRPQRWASSCRGSSSRITLDCVIIGPVREESVQVLYQQLIQSVARVQHDGHVECYEMFNCLVDMQPLKIIARVQWHPVPGIWCTQHKFSTTFQVITLKTNCTRCCSELDISRIFRYLTRVFWTQPDPRRII